MSLGSTKGNWIIALLCCMVLLLCSCLSNRSGSLRSSSTLNADSTADEWGDAADQSLKWLLSQYQGQRTVQDVAAELIRCSSSDDWRVRLAASLAWPQITLGGRYEPQVPQTVGEHDQFEQFLKELSEEYCQMQVTRFEREPGYFLESYRLVVWSGILFGCEDNAIPAQVALRAFRSIGGHNGPVSYWQLRGFHYLSHFWGRDDLRVGVALSNVNERTNQLVDWLDEIDKSGRNGVSVIVDQTDMVYRIKTLGNEVPFPPLAISQNPFPAGPRLRPGIVSGIEPMYAMGRVQRLLKTVGHEGIPR